jgi:3D-(3,5/4)-trihydroxycyclohexane-1,2-dione acylhydrolase (decyclizing)
LAINVQAYDAGKHGAMSLVADAASLWSGWAGRLKGVRFAAPDAKLKAEWAAAKAAVKAAPVAGNELPTDMQVVGAVQRASGPRPS